MSRKPNLKKLQLPKSSRITRSSKESNISDYFSQLTEPGKISSSEFKETVLTSQPAPIIELSDDNNEENMETKRRLRAKLSTFLSKEKSDALQKARQEAAKCDNKQQSAITNFMENDFESPPKKVKKAPPARKGPNSKPKPKSKPKKQTKLKTAFFKNEEMFSEIMAQHSMADDVNPDELQLALAISRSEAEVDGVLEEDSRESSSSGLKDIKKTLQKYGFKTTATEQDYDLLMPNRTKAKWANKFTPLTLRNSERQMEKLREKVKKLIGRREDKQPTLTPIEMELTSETLKSLQPVDKLLCRFDLESADLCEFYVQELFELSRTSAGHLLKDYRTIPGRDLSPLKEEKNKKVKEEKKFRKAARFVEKLFGFRAESADESVTLDLDSSFKTQQGSEEKSTVELFNGDECASSEENPDHMELEVQAHKRKVSKSDANPETDLSAFLDLIDKQESVAEEVTDLPSILITESCNEDDCLRSPEIKKSKRGSDTGSYLTPLKSSVTQTIKPNSPDLFADSDVDSVGEPEITETERAGVLDVEERGVGMSVYAVDNVKIPDESSCTNLTYPEDAVIDLTQDENDLNAGGESSEITIEYKTEIEPSDRLSISATFEPVVPSSTSQGTGSEDDCVIVCDDEDVFLSCRKEADESIMNDLSNYDLREEDDKNVNSLVEKDESATHFSHNSWKEELETTKQSLSQTSQSEDFSFQASQIQDVESENDCIILSDDEVNYSIRKTDKSTAKSNDEFYSTQTSSESEEEDAKENAANFSMLDLIQTQSVVDSLEPTENVLDYTNINEVLDNIETDLPGNVSSSTTPTKNVSRFESDDPFDLDRIRSQFGIMNDPTPVKERSTKSRKALSESFLGSTDFENHPTTPLAATDDSFNLSRLRTKYGIEKTPSTSSKHISHPALSHHPLKPSTSSTTGSSLRFSSSQKFSEFLTNDNEEDNFSDEMDEIDKLVYGSPVKKTPKEPQGLDKLLTADINLTDRSKPKKITPEKSSIAKMNEMQYNGKIYLYNTENVPEKPDFERMSSPTRRMHLDKYGLKPLKRRQAIVMLEYIYNQTHPFMVDEEEITTSLKTTVRTPQDETECGTPPQTTCTPSDSKHNAFQLEDCTGDVLLVYDELVAEAAKENYIFQTNVYKKNSTALLPFHVAWYNLVKSSTKLREAILHYEPIDLQEIYLFLKGIGYRYDPKDMKKFFDSRCIIFRYDLSDPSNNRHVRKTKKKTLSQRSKR